MLEPYPIYKPFQFVQQIEFKNKDINRPDLGLDYFGFIKTSHVVARTMIEYDIVFTKGNSNSVLEYCLRAPSEEEIQSILSQIYQFPHKYKDFIEAINNEPALEKYHFEPEPERSFINQPTLI